MLRALTKKQRAVVKDPAPRVSALCPRRAGKTFTASLGALITGEANPGSISIIISLNKQQLRRLYWENAPSGVFELARRFKLNLQCNSSFLKWTHENGSVGYLLGADDDEQLELIRGLEADLYVIDECKSFLAAKLDKLVNVIIEPQRASRRGRIVLIGTPGYSHAGVFWRATEIGALDGANGEGKPFLVPFGQKDPWGRTPQKDRIWSFHAWSLEDNTAQPHLWEEALITKRTNKYADDDPNWVLEFLGRWCQAGDGQVFRYGTLRATGRVTWVPERTKENPSGLPAEGAPWRLIGGLDLGFEAPTAFVVAAYSTRLKQLRHVADFSRRHLLTHDVAQIIRAAYDTYGPLETIFADMGNLGKMVVQSLIEEYGFPIEKADKREKFDYIELLNAAFDRGEVRIIEGTVLEHQLITNAWDLGDETKEEVARMGKLVEDKSIPNDSSDALLYLYRGSLHHFGAHIATPTPGYATPEWVRAWEKAQLAAARASFKADDRARTSNRNFTAAPRGIRDALRRPSCPPSRPTTSKSS